MKNILLIGVGGAGSKTVDIFYQRIKELGVQTDSKINAIVFDTDMGDIKQIKDATPIPMADPASVGTICDRLGNRYIREWFPCDDPAVRSQEMIRGASQWRKKSYLAFLNLMNKADMRTRFTNALEKMVVDPNASCEVYVISSIAGGTGSGSFIPIALFTKRYLRKSLGKDPIVNAMLLLPDIFAGRQTEDNKTKVMANGYAILRELNAINLVARNYNEGRTDRKKAQINLKIGSPNDPNVGVLFDSNDPEFWTPSAAPFSQVFMLDRIPLISPLSHNIVLANSLYTILCTKTGGAFDSEASNHEVVRSQNNGSNTIFAGISTSQINFPKDTILEYLAYERTYASCNNSWMTIHRMVEDKIKEREREAKETGSKYVMKDGEYAEILLEALSNLELNGNREVVELVDLGSAKYDSKTGKKEKNNTADDYFKSLDNFVTGLIPDSDTVLTQIKSKREEAAKKLTKDDVVSFAEELKPLLDGYFASCVETIRRTATSTADAVITFDPNKASFSGQSIALEENLLKRNKKYIHPVAAMVQLCRVKKELVKELETYSLDEPWKELKSRNAVIFPDRFCALNNITSPKGAYDRMGDNRFFDMVFGDHEDYMDSKTKPNADFDQLSSDAEVVLNKVCQDAISQIKMKIFKTVSDNIQLLLDKYREFFKRFEQEKENLAESVKSARRKDSGLVNSVENVYSSEECKKAILAEVSNDSGSETEDDLKEAYDIAGRGVFRTVYGAAAASKKVDESETGAAKFNDKDSAAYRSLFTDMVHSYSKFISRSDAFKKIAECNVIQAIEMECGEGAGAEVVSKKLFDHFKQAGTLAEPSLRVNMGGDMPELIQPSKIMVYMVSRNTGYYIKKRADFYEISVPADQASENDAIKACAETFIQRYSGNDSARVEIVDTMPDQILYCTGEIMDITPLRIEKFDELYTGEGSYFTYYQKAIANARKYDTDMWNPHLGFGFEKRGNLPYMNEKMEKICDEKMAKALLYALSSGEVYIGTMEIGKSAKIPAFYRLGEGSAIKTEENTIINMKNVAKLVSWIRNEDELIETFSARFDEEIASIENALPNIASDQEVETLKREITTSKYMGYMCCGLFKNTDASNEFNGPATIVGSKAGRDSNGNKIGPNIIELAYKIKVSEETMRDNDDAERVAIVAYKVFQDICAFRANPEANMERYIEIYKHELQKILVAIANSKLIQNAGANAEAYFDQIVSWLNGAGLFLDIPEDDPFEGSSIKYRRYKVPRSDADEVRKALQKAAANVPFKKADAVKTAENEAEDSDDENIEESDEVSAVESAE